MITTLGLLLLSFDLYYDGIICPVSFSQYHQPAGHISYCAVLLLGESASVTTFCY